MTKGTQKVPVRARVLDNPHEHEPPQATKQRTKDIDRDAELSLIHAVVRARERPGGPVAQGPHEDGEHAARECTRPEVAVLRDVEVVGRDAPDLREDVGRGDEEGDEHGADHEDPEDGRVDEVDEDLREEVRDRLGRVAGPLPGREGLRVGAPWGLLRWARWVDCLGLLVPALFFLGSVGAGLGLRGVWGSGAGSDELGFWQQEDGCQKPDDIERQLGHKQILIPVVLEHHAADYRHHRRHAGQRADYQCRAPSALMQVEHVSDGGQGQALPGCHPKALDQAAGEEGVIIVLLRADDADDGSHRTCRGCEEKLWTFAILLSEYGDEWSLQQMSNQFQ